MSCATTVPNLYYQRRFSKPCRSEWHGYTRDLLNRAANDAKASLVASGYMKTAEDRELLIVQAWDRANLYYKRGHGSQKIETRQIQYVSIQAISDLTHS
jgi:hypothetical protein